MSRTGKQEVHLPEQSAYCLEEWTTVEESLGATDFEKAADEHNYEERLMLLSESDRVLLREIEAEFGPMKPNHTSRIDSSKITLVIPVYVNPALLKHEES